MPNWTGQFENAHPSEQPVLGVQHDGPPEKSAWVRLAYQQRDRIFGVRARYCILACYNRLIPWLLPEIPARQKQALEYPVNHYVHLPWSATSNATPIPDAVRVFISPTVSWRDDAQSQPGDAAPRAFRTTALCGLALSAFLRVGIASSMRPALTRFIPWRYAWAASDSFGDEEIGAGCAHPAPFDDHP